jgi:DnaJ-class molecular chaperone
MNNYYLLLNINKEATNEEITEAYKLKISQFKNLPFLTSTMKEEIKELKKALYILSDDERRQQYNNIINNDYETNDDLKENTKICDRLFSLKRE